MSPPLIIAVSDATAYELMAFEGVPLLEPGLIVVSAMGSRPTWQLARQLVDELRTVLLASAPVATVTTIPDRPADPTAIDVFAESHRRQVLVLVCEEADVDSKSWLAPWTDQEPVARRIMPVFKEGSQPNQWLPEILRPFNAEFWSQGITEVVPAVLSSAGITLDSQRVFISYRRLETEPLAQQLFDRLTRAGFDVFLDRFSIESGVNFQQRLYQELLDKSMVLLLESAHIDGSTWTQEEIAFVRRYGLGLLALKLPDRETGLVSVDPDERYELEDEWFVVSTPKQVDNPKRPEDRAPGEPATFNQWSELDKDELEKVVNLAKRVHDLATFRRRRDVRENVIAVLKTFAGVVPSTAGTDGILHVDVTDDQGKKHDFGLWLTTRPPDFVDFHSTYVRSGQPPQWKGVVCGPADVLERNRRDKLAWMSRVSGYGCFDLADLAAMAEKMQKGTL
jgi:hypothetical protein